MYYKYISKHTFDTKFIDIPPKYAKSIVTFYRYRYCNAKEDTLSMDIVTNLRELRDLLDKEIKSSIEYWYKDDTSYKEEDKGVFIRFSNRSPKDGHKVYKDYQENKENEETESKQTTESKESEQEKKEKADKIKQDPNAAFIEFCRSTIKDLYVTNGDDAMALILSSERVFTDLLAVINAHKYPYKYLFHDQFTIDTIYDNDDEEKKYIEENDDELKWKEDKWDICRCSVAIRKWDNRIRDDLEFRCFVYDKKIRAISQYNHYCYFKELGDNPLFEAAIKDKVSKYFYENIVELLPYHHYIIDFGIIIKDENNKENIDGLDIIIIELNPFATTTGAGLFGWNNDIDILKHSKEIEMRVHHKNVLRVEFVEHYLNDCEKYAVEKPWFLVLDEIELIIKEGKNKKSQDGKKKNCIIL